MRLDKYLKVSRLIKRRTVANEACDAGKITVNDKVARASYDVKVGDVIEITLGSKSVKVKVTEIDSQNRINLSRKELLFRKQLNLFFIFTMYFGGGMVPYYMVLKSLGMLNNFIVFIFPNLVSVYNMILVKNYIEGMPAEIFESAKIDGANDLTVFFKMVIPLSKPIIMTIALFVAITHWNSWFDAYLFTNAQSLKTMQSILVEILNQYQTSSANQAANTITPDSIRMAATMIATIPIIMVYPFIQKYFVKGIMLGSVKS